MKHFGVAKIGVLVVASAVWCYGQHGRGGSAAGSHMGGPPSGAGASSGSPSGHGSQSGSSQSQKPSPDQLLNQNTKLASNLQKLLPAGTTPQQACQNFKNLGQCVAAIHVSNNLGIPFSDLEAKVTGPNAESLGKAIHQLNPNVNSGAEQKKAKKQAQNDLNGTGS